MLPRSLAAALAVVGLGGCLAIGPLVAEDDEGGDGDDIGEESGTAGDLHPCGPTSARVERVIDGDTIVLTSGERVRYILVDTPEITDGKNECWGQQARTHNIAMVAGEDVTLEYDAECRDDYGRLLAYVSVGELEVNRTLLEDGDACLLFVPPNGSARLAEYQQLADMAKAASAGLWGACGERPC